MLDTFEVQKKIFSVLTASGIVSGRIFDAIPDHGKPRRGDAVSYPFIEIGDFLVEPDDKGRAAGNLIFVTIQVYTRGRGKREAVTLSDEVSALFHQVRFDFDDATVMRCLTDNIQVFNEGDNRAYRAVIRLRINHEE